MTYITNQPGRPLLGGTSPRFLVGYRFSASSPCKQKKTLGVLQMPKGRKKRSLKKAHKKGGQQQVAEPMQAAFAASESRERWLGNVMDTVSAAEKTVRAVSDMLGPPLKSQLTKPANPAKLTRKQRLAKLKKNGSVERKRQCPTALPSSREALLEATKDLNYNARMEYVARIAASNKDKPELFDLIDALNDQPKPQEAPVELSELEAKLMPGQRSNVRFYDWTQMAMQMAVAAAGTCSLLKERQQSLLLSVLTSPSTTVRKMALNAIVRQIQDDSAVADYIRQAPPAVRDRLISNCLRYKRAGVLELLVEEFANLYGIDAAARFLHGCRSDIVKTKLEQKDMRNSRAIRWHQLVVGHGHVVLDLMDKDLSKCAYGNTDLVWMEWKAILGAKALEWLVTKADADRTRATRLSKMLLKYPHNKQWDWAPSPVFLWDEWKQLSEEKFPAKPELQVYVSRVAQILRKGQYCMPLLGDDSDFTKTLFKRLPFLWSTICRGTAWYDRRSTPPRVHLLPQTVSPSDFDALPENFDIVSLLTTLSAVPQHDETGWTTALSYCDAGSFRIAPKAEIEIFKLVQDQLQKGPEHGASWEDYRNGWLYRFLNHYQAMFRAIEKRFKSASMEFECARVEHAYGRIYMRFKEVENVREMTARRTDFCQRLCQFLLTNALQLIGKYPPSKFKTPNVSKAHLHAAYQDIWDTFQGSNQYFDHRFPEPRRKTFALWKVLPWYQSQTEHKQNLLQNLLPYFVSRKLNAKEVEERDINTQALRQVFKESFKQLKRELEVNPGSLWDMFEWWGYLEPDDSKALFQLLTPERFLTLAGMELDVSVMARLFNLISSQRIGGLLIVSKLVDNVLATAKEKLAVEVQDELLPYQTVTPAVLSSFIKNTDSNSIPQRVFGFKVLLTSAVLNRDVKQLTKTLQHFVKKIKNERALVRFLVLNLLYGKYLNAWDDRARGDAIEWDNFYQQQEKRSQVAFLLSQEVLPCYTEMLQDAIEVQDLDLHVEQDEVELLCFADPDYDGDPADLLPEDVLEAQHLCSALWRRLGEKAASLQFKVDFGKSLTESRKQTQYLKAKASMWVDTAPDLPFVYLDADKKQASEGDSKEEARPHSDQAAKTDSQRPCDVAGESAFVQAVLDGYEAKLADRNPDWRSGPTAHFYLLDLFYVTGRNALSVPALGAVFNELLDGLEEYDTDAEGLTVLNGHDPVLVIGSNLLQLSGKQWWCFDPRTGPILQRYVEAMMRSRQARRVLWEWCDWQEATHPNAMDPRRAARHERRHAIVHKLLAISKSAIHLRFVWRFLVRYDQTALSKSCDFLNPRSPLYGPFYLEPHDRGTLPSKKAPQETPPRGRGRRRMQQRVSYPPVNPRRNWFQTLIPADMTKQLTLETEALAEQEKEMHEDIQNRQDFENWFRLPAYYGLHRLRPAQLVNFGTALIRAALSEDRGLPDRVKAAIHYTVLPDISAADCIKLREDFRDPDWERLKAEATVLEEKKAAEEAKKELEQDTRTGKGKSKKKKTEKKESKKKAAVEKKVPVNLQEALMKGVVYNNEKAASLGYLLQPKFLSSQEARIAAYALDSCERHMLPPALEKVVRLVLTGQRRTALKVTAYKAVLRLVAKKVSAKSVAMILHEWNREELHRDVRITIIQMAISFLKTNHDFATGPAWEILYGAVRFTGKDQLEILTTLLGALPAGHGVSALNQAEKLVHQVKLAAHLSELTKYSVPAQFAAQYAHDIIHKLVGDESLDEDLNFLSLFSLLNWLPYKGTSALLGELLSKHMANTRPEWLVNPVALKQKVHDERWQYALRSLVKFSIDQEVVGLGYLDPRYLHAAMEALVASVRRFSGDDHGVHTTISPMMRAKLLMRLEDSMEVIDGSNFQRGSPFLKVCETKMEPLTFFWEFFMRRRLKAMRYVDYASLVEDLATDVLTGGLCQSSFALDLIHKAFPDSPPTRYYYQVNMDSSSITTQYKGLKKLWQRHANETSQSATSFWCHVFMIALSKFKDIPNRIDPPTLIGIFEHLLDNLSNNSFTGLDTLGISQTHVSEFDALFAGRLLRVDVRSEAPGPLVAVIRMAQYIVDGLCEYSNLPEDGPFDKFLEMPSLLSNNDPAGSIGSDQGKDNVVIERIVQSVTCQEAQTKGKPADWEENNEEEWYFGTWQRKVLTEILTLNVARKDDTPATNRQRYAGLCFDTAIRVLEEMPNLAVHEPHLVTGFVNEALQKAYLFPATAEVIRVRLANTCRKLFSAAVSRAKQSCETSLADEEKKHLTAKQKNDLVDKAVTHTLNQKLLGFFVPCFDFLTGRSQPNDTLSTAELFPAIAKTFKPYRAPTDRSSFWGPIYEREGKKTYLTAPFRGKDAPGYKSKRRNSVPAWMCG
eukprot:g81078.t1